MFPIWVFFNMQKYDLIVQKDAAPFSATTLDVTEKVIAEIH